ncbi:MAG: copper resistance D family protein [Acidimicrobiales bacterium]
MLTRPAVLNRGPGLNRGDGLTRPAGLNRRAGLLGMVFTMASPAGAAWAHAGEGAGAAAAASIGTGLVSPAFATARGLVYLSTAVLVGGLVFVTAIWPAGSDNRRATRILWVAWATLALGSVAGIALAGLDRAGFGLGHDLWDRQLLADTLDSRFGRAWAARAILLLPTLPVLAALSLHGQAASGTLWWRTAAAGVGIGLLRTPGFISHPTFAEPAWLGSVVDLVHLSALSIWIGGLVMLVATVLGSEASGSGAEDRQRVVARFSGVAFTSVAVVIGTGTVMSWLLVRSWGSLFNSDYGQTLLLKLAVVAALLAVAQRSRRLVDRRMTLAPAGSGMPRLNPLAVSVGSEVVLAAAVISVAAVLVNVSPPT